MSKSTFEHLCRELRPLVQKQCTPLREPLDVDERVAITLWRLATNIEYRTLGHLFGVGRSTAGAVTLETCRAIQKLMPKYVYLHVGEAMKHNVEGFEVRWGFPQAAGAIDGTHIPILRPPGESGSDYYNRKGFYSIVMQAVVDFRGRFMDAYIGWPGKVHDARVLANSSLYIKGEAGTFLPDLKRQLNGINVPLCILGDPAYPALNWLMKVYPEHGNMSSKEKLFNYCLSRARMIVENAFGCLKGRWRCLLKRNDSQVTNVISITSACVVLHNICEAYNDECLCEWVDECGPTPLNPTTANTQAVPPSHVRDAIATHIFNNQ